MFEIYQDKSGNYRFRLVARNGENILSSEAYTTKAACKNGIKSVIKNAADKEKFEVKEGRNGKFYFVLKAGNNQVIGQSQMYASKRGASCGIRSVVNNAQKGEVVDTTEQK